MLARTLGLVRRRTRNAFVLIVAAFAGACGSGATGPTPSFITVTGPAPAPQLGVTRFLAFGDSITEGKSGTLAMGDPYGFDDTGPTWSYPSRFRARLKSGYPLQAEAFVVTNAGCGGEPVVTVGACSGTSGQSRLEQRLIAYAPEVLLLMEGVNDLNSFGRPAINDVLAGLHAMMKDAQSRGVQVILATLPPQRPGGLRAGSAALIQEVNEGIRSIADRDGAILADVYQAFAGSPDPWIDTDGLHPTEQGYDRIAETFFAATQVNFELKHHTMRHTGITMRLEAGVNPRVIQKMN